MSNPRKNWIGRSAISSPSAREQEMNTTKQVENLVETIDALKGVIQGIINLARDPAGATFTLREALNQYEFKAALAWLDELKS